MATNAQLDRREIKVQIRDQRLGEWEPWHDLWHIDPITVKVEHGQQFVDVFDSDLINLTDDMWTWDDCKGQREFRFVWSDTEEWVKGVCPGCDDVFPVSEGVPGDDLNEGFNAVCCGCTTP